MAGIGQDGMDLEELLQYAEFEYSDDMEFPVRARVHEDDWARVDWRGPAAELRLRATYLPARQALEDTRVLLQEPGFHRATGVQPVGTDPVGSASLSFFGSNSLHISNALY